MINDTERVKPFFHFFLEYLKHEKLTYQSDASNEFCLDSNLKLPKINSKSDNDNFLEFVNKNFWDTDWWTTFAKEEGLLWTKKVLLG